MNATQNGTRRDARQNSGVFAGLRPLQLHGRLTVVTPDDGLQNGERGAPMVSTVFSNNAAPAQSGVLIGLTEAEAAHRRAQGQGNAVTFAPSRSYFQILRDNALMSINVIVFAVGLALALMGLFNDALLTVGLVLLNILIAVIEEERAKRALDRIALLTRPKAAVIREAKERSIDPAEIVVGDLLVAGPGDQVVVDGRVVDDDGAVMDESLLNGESEPVPKSTGDPVYSGSFSVSGRLIYAAERVGIASMANQLTAQARAFRQTKTPVQREVDLVLRLMVVLILVLGGPIIFDLLIRVLGTLVSAVGGPFADTLERAYQGYSVQESVRSAAVIIGLVPQGLALMLTVTYAMGALRLAGKQALLQQANAVESLSHVDVLCFDKTGTLTTNRLTYHDSQPLGASPAELTAALADYVASTPNPNRTIDAIAEALPGHRRTAREEVAFSSSRKWSALSFADPERPGLYVLGAPEVLLSRLRPGTQLGTESVAWVASGLRVLLFAHSPETMQLDNTDGTAQLPSNLRPLGLVSLRDELHPDASATIARFAEAGIALKIISGDHPETVAALVRQAGFVAERAPRVISGLDLAAMDDAAVAVAAEEGQIFGRITPDQKLHLIEHLQRAGHYVAMVGDGVNDVLALKQAEVGVAMEGGSQATRAVADLVLLGNSFAALPAAFREGQRIVRGTQDLLKLFLARSLSVAIAILGAGIIGAAFPVLPTHNALPALLTIGIPTLALAAWARPGRMSSSLLRTVLPFAMPAALTMGAVEGALYISYLRATDDIMVARTVQTSVAVLCGLLLILFVEPPTRAWVGGDELSRDWRPVALVLAMLGLFALVMNVPGLRAFFELAPLTPLDIAIVGVVAAGWALGLRFIWRARLLQRWLSLDLG